LSLDLIMPPPSKRPPSKRPVKRAQPKRAASLVNALAEAAWTEADAALAEALIECRRAVDAKSKKARDEALELLSLSLGRAARRRGLARIGKRGSLEDFDPARHELPGSARRTPARVRVIEEGVMRGREVLIKARVASPRSKRR
jgi:hypothetical protein